ncbi:hypothetical protein RAE19_19230 [Rhodoferax sp. TBRC 17660]|uniref:Uncharacterized protein n=1 Tax=Rhodoferax potami TaxID=3068338 RepID=A0ABU3KTG0_9BURK|nr:hypothetical protein [Rhodoferax sp. TBRC 17660]MDT7520773.1 hypothetical protein [Rhodoferax sp. TBRC 17660]
MQNINNASAAPIGTFGTFGTFGTITESNSKSNDLQNAGTTLRHINSAAGVKYSSVNPNNQNLRQDTHNGMSCFKRFFSRVAGVVVGTVRAALNFLWSPVTAGKYLIVAMVQAYRGEGQRALTALGLAVTAPLWAPVDGFLKGFKACVDDNRELTEDNKSDRNGLEELKAYVKDGVITPADQKDLNILPGFLAWEAVKQFL